MDLGDISKLQTKTSLALTDEIAVSNKGRDSRPEKTTLSALQTLIGGGGGGGGSAQIYTGTTDDPTAQGLTPVFPADINKGAIYYKDQAVPPVVWLWSVNDSDWFNVLS